MASKADRTIPNLENATPGFLTDEIAKLRAETSRLKFLEGVYKQALEARVTPEQLKGNAPVLGDTFDGHYEEVTQERIDSDAVREYFANDAEGLKKVTKVLTFKQFKVSPKVNTVI